MYDMILDITACMQNALGSIPGGVHGFFCLLAKSQLSTLASLLPQWVTLHGNAIFSQALYKHC
jgi:hypothetical protein